MEKLRSPHFTLPLIIKNPSHYITFLTTRLKDGFVESNLIWQEQELNFVSQFERKEDVSKS